MNKKQFDFSHSNNNEIRTIELSNTNQMWRNDEKWSGSEREVYLYNDSVWERDTERIYKSKL